MHKINQPLASGIGVMFMWMITSCNNGHTDASTSHTIELTTTETKLSPPDFMDIVEWISLDAENSDYLSEAKKIIDFDNRYYVLDNVGQRCVVAYDATGKQICKIGRMGGGPGEYLSALDFAIDSKTNSLLILTGEQKAIKYSLDGKFIKSYQLPSESFANITCSNGHIWLSTNFSTPTNSNLVYFYDSDFNQVGEFMAYDEFARPAVTLFKGNLQTFDDKTYYIDEIGLRIYQFSIDPSNVSEIASFTLPTPMPKDSFKDGMQFMEQQSQYDWLMQVSLLPHHIYVNYVAKGKLYGGIYDLNGNALFEGALIGPATPCFPSDGDTVITPISIDEYFWYWEKQDIRKPDVTPTEDDNMLLAKWKIKE